MVRWIVASSLKFRRLILAAAVGLVVIGIFQAGRTPVDVLPEFSRRWSRCRPRPSGSPPRRWSN